MIRKMLEKVIYSEGAYERARSMYTETEANNLGRKAEISANAGGVVCSAVISLGIKSAIDYLGAKVMVEAIDKIGIDPLWNAVETINGVDGLVSGGGLEGLAYGAKAAIAAGVGCLVLSELAAGADASFYKNLYNNNEAI